LGRAGGCRRLKPAQEFSIDCLDAGLKCLRENRVVPTGLCVFLSTLPSAEGTGLTCSAPTALHSGPQGDCFVPPIAWQSGSHAGSEGQFHPSGTAGFRPWRGLEINRKSTQGFRPGLITFALRAGSGAVR